VAEVIMAILGGLLPAIPGLAKAPVKRVIRDR